jgi:polyisoprenoid-binding protein YceI
MRHAALAALLLIGGGALSACATSKDVAPPPAPALAAPTPIVNSPFQAPSGAYEADPAHTSVTWRINHLGLSMYTARFSKVAATLAFNAEAPTKSTLEVTIATAAVDTGLPKFNTEISDKFLGGKANPTIKFVSTAIERTGEDTGKVTGDLTLNGVTKPATLEVKFYGAKVIPLGKPTQRLGFSARTTINRGEWGVDAAKPFVGDAVELIIETEFVKT